jgi:hypothetical protein
LYQGPVGVVGVGVQQLLDLSELPAYLREQKSFRDDWRVFVRRSNLDVSDVVSSVDFSADNTKMIFTLTSLNVDAQIDIEAWFMHSVVR